MLLVSMDNRTGHLRYKKRRILVGLLIDTQFIGLPQNLQEELQSNKIKRVKTAIFRDFCSLLLTSSKNIFPLPYHKKLEKLNYWICQIGDCNLAQDVRTIRQKQIGQIYSYLKMLGKCLVLLLYIMVNLIIYYFNFHVLLLLLITIFSNQIQNFQFLKPFV